MFCRASTALWAFDRNTWAHAHPPHCPPERQKWDLSDKLPPLSRTLWKCKHCKRPLNLSCGAVTVGFSCFSLYLWALFGVPAPYATCRMFMGLQVTVAASEWYLGGNWEAWLCRIPGPTTVLVLDIIPALYLSSGSCSSSPSPSLGK